MNTRETTRINEDTIFDVTGDAVCITQRDPIGGSNNLVILTRAEVRVLLKMVEAVK